MQNPIRLGEGIVVRTTHAVSLTRVETAARSYRENYEALLATPVLALFSKPGNASFARKHSLPPNVFLMSSEALDGATVGTLLCSFFPFFRSLLYHYYFLVDPLNQVLIRVAHKFAIGEDAEFSKPANASLDIVAALLNLHVKVVTEVSLTANKLLAGPFAVSGSLTPPESSPYVSSLTRSRPRLEFAAFEESKVREATTGVFENEWKATARGDLLPSVVLEPLQIRTFLFSL